MKDSTRGLLMVLMMMPVTMWSAWSHDFYGTLAGSSLILANYMAAIYFVKRDN